MPHHQLLITLQYAPDKVDELVLKAAQRFIAFGEALPTFAQCGRHAHRVSELVTTSTAIRARTVDRGGR